MVTFSSIYHVGVTNFIAWTTKVHLIDLSALTFGVTWNLSINLQGLGQTLVTDISNFLFVDVRKNMIFTAQLLWDILQM